MYNADYKEAFLITTLQAVELSPATEEAAAVRSCIPVLPVPVTSYQLAIDGRVYIDGQHIPEGYAGRECLVHCTFKADKMLEVEAFPGYINGVGAQVRSHPRYAEFWPEGTAFVANCDDGYIDR
jgi:hypothetical protein